MAIKHKTVGTSLTQAEFEAAALHEGLDAAVSKPTRAFATAYSNGLNLRFVYVTATLIIASGASLSLGGYVENANPPTVIAAAQTQYNNGAGNLVAEVSVCFLVPAGQYYKVTATAGASVGCWTEYEIG
jgi:hypothetical protein